MLVKNSALAAPVASVPAAPVAAGPPAAPAAPTAPAPRHKSDPSSLLKIAQFNVWNFYDTVDDPKITHPGEKVFKKEEYDARVSKVARFIKNQLGAPDVLSLNEIENEGVLADLLGSPELKSLGYKSVLGTLNDARGIRTAILYRSDRLSVDKVEEYNPEAKLPGGQGQLDPSRLWARAPLAIDFRLTGAAQASEGAQNLTVISNHFKSKLGGASQEPRRQAQGTQLGAFVDARRAATPQTPVIVLGDFNATPQDGAYRNLARRPDKTYRLYDAAAKVTEKERYTYNYRGQHDLLDHVFYTSDMKKALVSSQIPHYNTAKGSEKLRFDPSVPEGASDHDAIVTQFDLSKVRQPRP